jgi:hypothetical protein
MRQLSEQDAHKMAAVQATRALLEPRPEDEHATSARAAAGLVIVIGAPQAPPPTVEITPTPSHLVPSGDTRDM